jgi:hypothetical protein
MHKQRVYWVGIAAAAWLLWGGMSVKDARPSKPHAGASNAAHGECPAVPGDAKPIAGLQTAWAIRNETSNGVRLVFADHPRACADLDRFGSSNIDGPCTPSWQFAFTLPPDAQMPGVYNLHDYEADYARQTVESVPSSGGCQQGDSCMGGSTGAAGGAKGPESTIEIYSVSEECVTGRIHRLETGQIQPPPPDYTGTFQAVVCKPSAN